MFRGLSTDQAPPFEVVYRFFLVAPISLTIIGFILIFGDTELILSRHSNLAISIIHLFTIGYMSMIMIGASMQFLPVIVGAVYENPKTITKYLLSSLILFLILFVYGFLNNQNEIFFYASYIIFVAILYFSIISIRKIDSLKLSDFTSKSIKIAFILFIIGLILGVNLLLSFSNNNFSQYHFDIAFAHSIIMLFGWGLFFILAIAFKVIPMFWVASDYEKSQIKLFHYLLFFVFVLIVLNIFLQNQTIKIVALSNLSIVLLSFSYITIDKLNNRKRKVSDISVELWQSSMKWLFSGGILIFLNLFINIDSSISAPLFAVVFGYGFIVSLTIGMLYKIIPFLSWWHSSTTLAQKGIFSVPTIKDMIPNQDIVVQKKLHYLTLLFLVIGIKSVLILKVASILMIISNIYLYKNFSSAINTYKKLILS